MNTKNAPQIIEHIQKTVTYTPHEVRWIQKTARFVTCGVGSNGKGVAQVYELSKGELKIIAESPSVSQ